MEEEEDQEEEEEEESRALLAGTPVTAVTPNSYPKTLNPKP